MHFQIIFKKLEKYIYIFFTLLNVCIILLFERSQSCYLLFKQAAYLCCKQESEKHSQEKWHIYSFP